MREITESPDMFRKRLHELYLHHHGHVQRACKRYVQNRDDADDLTVEVLLKAARGSIASDRKPLANPRTWLYRVAANHCVDYLRRRNWRLDRMRLYAAHQSAIPDAEPEPDRSPLLFGEYARVLQILREDLSPEERRILHLLFDAGLRQETVARITGVSRGSVARVLARIRTRALAIRLSLLAAEKRPLQT